MSSTFSVKGLVLLTTNDDIAYAAEELGMDEGKWVLCQLFVDLGAVLCLRHVGSPRLVTKVSVAEFADASPIGHLGSTVRADWNDNTGWSRCFDFCLSKTRDALLVAVSTDVSLPILVPEDLGFTDDTHLLAVGAKLSDVGDLQHRLLALGPWSVLGGPRT